MSDPAQREEAVFTAAMKLAESQRAAYLQEVCGGDAQLRARVEAMLQAIVQPVEPDKTRVISFTVTEKPGDRIGRYKLLEQIGEGGFGVVYVAEQEQPVRRRVALKIIKLGMDTKEVVARFEAERQALAMMDHPNIAKVFDAGATPNGRPYFVMELVRGIKITEYCDQNQLSTQERLKLFAQVCQAVQHAHQKGIIHRDIKPPNILVTVLDKVAMPKVIDFGIAKATQGHLTDKTVYTELQQFIGTPAYMSPEQAEMSSLDIDTRTDIYSLGVLLYELLTGKTPFDSSQLLAGGLDGMRRIIREKEPLRPSTQLTALSKEEQTALAARHRTEPSRLIYAVRGDLDWIVTKALEKDRTRRYDTANGLAMDIERHLNNEPVLARSPSTFYLFQKTVRRNKLAWVAAAVVVATLMLGVLASTQQAIRARRAEQEQSRLRVEAETARQQAMANAQRAEASAREARNALATSDFFEATRLVEADDGPTAVAYLARILSADSDNYAALTRLANLLTYRSWMIPKLILNPGSEVNSAQFSPDGTRIVTASADNTAQVWDATSGQPVGEPLKAEGPVYFAQFSPDGKRVVTASGLIARVWDAQTGQPLTESLQHRGPVNIAQFSPDGRLIATISGNTALVWDAQTGQPITVLQHGNLVNSAEFSPDGKRIVTASYDNTARVWDAQTGQPLTGSLKHGDTDPTHDFPVYFAQFSPDGKRIVTASYDNTARVWDAQTGQLLVGTMKHGGRVQSAHFSPDGKRIVTASYDNTTRVWDAQTGRPLFEPLKHGGPVTSAKFSLDGKYIVTASDDNTARVWDAQTGRPLTEPLQHGSSVRFAQFSPDGQRVLSVSSDNRAQVWDMLTVQALTEPMRHGKEVYSAQFSPDGKRIVTASYDNTARVWDAQTTQPLTEALRHEDRVLGAEFSADGKRIVTASYDNTARVWDAQTGHTLGDPLRHGGLVMTAHFSPDGKRIVTASYDYTARVWDAQTGQPLTESLKHSDLVNFAQFSPDGKRIVTASYDTTARVWDAQTAQPLTEALRHGDRVLCADFSPDGQRIVTSSSDGTIRIWDALTGRLVTGPLHHGGIVNGVHFSPDGKRVVSHSSANTARVWDALSGQPLSEPLKHAGWVFAAEFSPDGKRIVTASWDNTARVWDAQTGQPLTDPFKHKDRVYGARFSPDGKRIVTASFDKTARVWDVGFAPARCPDWLLPLAEALAGCRLNKQGFLESTSLDRVKTIAQVRADLKKQPADGDGVMWGRWILADPATRTISPFSKIGVPKYIENRIKENSAASLAEAERLAVGNTALSLRVVQAKNKIEQTNGTANP